MKKTNIFVILILLAMGANAQYEKKTSVLSFGAGFGSSLGSYGASSQTPALSLQIEHGITKAGPGVVSGGAYLGYKGYSYTYLNYKSKWSYAIIGFRGAYHYTGFDLPNVDVYGGLMLSYSLLRYTDSDNNTSIGTGSKVNVSVYAGGRYYFAKKLGVFAEAGYGISYLNAGLSLTL